MLNVTSLRNRYSQVFFLFVLCSLIYVASQGIGSGIAGFEDGFYKRGFLIEQANLLRIKMGDHVFPVALMGKDGWMEYTGEGNIDDFQNIKTLKNKKKLGEELAALNTYLQSQGITLLIVVAPNKASIYPDKLSEQIQPLSTQSKLDSLISYLEENNLPIIVDLRPALRSARVDQDVYYKTDTHWNGYGAFVAYTTIINTLGDTYPELHPYEITDLELVTEKPEMRDIPKTLNAKSITEPGFFFAPSETFVQTSHLDDYLGYNQFSWIEDSKLPTLLMFHDSFGSSYMDNYLNNYLSMNFAKSHFVQIQSMAEYLTQESIQQFDPNVIVIEIVERNIYLLPDYLSNFVLE